MGRLPSTAIAAAAAAVTAAAAVDAVGATTEVRAQPHGDPGIPKKAAVLIPAAHQHDASIVRKRQGVSRARERGARRVPAQGCQCVWSPSRAK
jgi:hypothetical protein